MAERGKRGSYKEKPKRIQDLRQYEGKYYYKNRDITALLKTLDLNTLNPKIKERLDEIHRANRKYTVGHPEWRYLTEKERATFQDLINFVNKKTAQDFSENIKLPGPGASNLPESETSFVTGDFPPPPPYSSPPSRPPGEQPNLDGAIDDTKFDLGDRFSPGTEKNQPPEETIESDEEEVKSKTVSQQTAALRRRSRINSESLREEREMGSGTAEQIAPRVMAQQASNEERQSGSFLHSVSSVSKVGRAVDDMKDLSEDQKQLSDHISTIMSTKQSKGKSVGTQVNQRIAIDKLRKSLPTYNRKNRYRLLQEEAAEGAASKSGGFGGAGVFVNPQQFTGDKSDLRNADQLSRILPILPTSNDGLFLQRQIFQLEINKQNNAVKNAELAARATENFMSRAFGRPAETTSQSLVQSIALLSDNPAGRSNIDISKALAASVAPR